jgi:hypothetical protein
MFNDSKVKVLIYFYYTKEPRKLFLLLKVFVINIFYLQKNNIFNLI